MIKRCDHNKNKLSNCPICVKREVQFNMKKTFLKNNFSTSSPSPFVGRFNYPNINVGILSPQKLDESNWKYDSPKFWSNNNLSINEILKLRSGLINSQFNTNIKSVLKRTKLMDMSREVGMASKPVEFEIQLNNLPKYSTIYDKYIAPTGPKAIIKKADIISNPKIHQKVEKVYDDFDLKAEQAINYLYKNKFDENFLSKLLSVGTIGLKKDRKLVPTRWSITATDDIIGKQIIQEIKDYQVSDIKSYFGGYLGNYYLILFFPNRWAYELFEIVVNSKKNPWSKNDLNYATDFENYEGRKKYVDETAGGYYAPRLAILEKLKDLKKQASVLVIRFITDEYNLPLGVWVTREATRKAINNSSLDFASEDLMIKYAKLISIKKFGINLDDIFKKSKLLDLIYKQRKLIHY